MYRYLLLLFYDFLLLVVITYLIISPKHEFLLMALVTEMRDRKEQAAFDSLSMSSYPSLIIGVMGIHS